jgi:hypothetical protein
VKHESGAFVTVGGADFDIYAVGLFLDVRHFRATRDWRRLRYGLGFLGRRLRERNWRAVRNYFNGYLAEPIDYPDEQWHCAGRGWTRPAAKRNFWRRNRSASAAAR